MMLYRNLIYITGDQNYGQRRAIKGCGKEATRGNTGGGGETLICWLLLGPPSFQMSSPVSACAVLLFFLGFHYFNSWLLIEEKECFSKLKKRGVLMAFH